ncbi:hypothetical protein BDB00DRAFT_506621 [Zychaea mexicana]|uniref:uncharacterized protein n=1 Tax=Zychaea mexicana TaxID=64656 RepID=UPI0022FEED0F|nr:uncharacterized protein BDB00DRAFT_506621 [Zychaea mexicana]KAI9491241.1 hypothetical protein BDB00DRAFT_506621 [Zychaea mexicana]
MVVVKPVEVSAAVVNVKVVATAITTMTASRAETATAATKTIREHEFSAKPRLNAKKIDFAKLTLPVDLNARRDQSSDDALQWADTFGTILLLFSHQHQGKKMILCLLRLELDAHPATFTNIPIGTHSQSRLYVTDASHLDCLAMQLKSINIENRHYYLYPDMRRHNFLNSSKI